MFIVESPATFETPVDQRKEPETPDLRNPMSNRSSTSELSDKNKDEQKNITDNHSLDSFLDKYTSEDNNSFQEIIEAADRKLRQKFSVLFEAEEQQAIEMRNRLALPSIEKQFDKIEGPKTVDTWNYKNKNYVMYVPDGVNLTKEEEIEMAKRKQEIVHSNTRLHSNPFDENQSKNTISELAKTQNKGLIGKIGVDGNTLTVSDTPEVRGFSFVKSPSPCPGVAESPLMTWGEIEGTPFRLDGSDTPIRPSAGPSFRIAETTRREVIALELAEKAGERLRGQKAKAIEAAKRNMKSPYVRSSIDRLASMSPAAKRLASMKFGLRESPLTPRPSPGGICKTPNKKSLTPSPMITKKTPVINRKTNTSQTVVDTSITETNTLTDDLLKIPEIKRHRASDFF